MAVAGVVVVDGSWQARHVWTAGIDLAAQPAKTGAVVVNWATEPPTVVQMTRIKSPTSRSSRCAAK
ncbi:MAG: hypothetical protein LC808_08305 [Actinobacteria bacterium]|nr:hypothetical protein [Actinomycetota bacterium]